MGLSRLIRELEFQKREVARLDAGVAKLELEKAYLSHALQQAQCALVWHTAQRAAATPEQDARAEPNPPLPVVRCTDLALGTSTHATPKPRRARFSEASTACSPYSPSTAPDVESPPTAVQSELKVETPPRAEVQSELKVETPPRAEVQSELKVETPPRAEVQSEL